VGESRTSEGRSMPVVLAHSSLVSQLIVTQHSRWHLLRFLDWKDAPFSKLQVLPTDGKPVDSSLWYNHDEALADVARGIRKAVERWRK
jgi:hypothetical protein